MLKVTTLIENHEGEGLINEHGLSLFIEFDNKRFLFDTGQSGKFIDNAKKLGVDLSNLDFLMISHGHYDHANGYPRLKEEFSPKKVYVGKGFFNGKYKTVKDVDGLVYNGINFTKSNEFIEIDEDITYLSDNIMIFKNFKRVNDYELINPRFKDKDGNIDLFSDEIALGLKTAKGLVLIVGCSHVGICNIIEHVKSLTHLEVYMLIGGTHLVEADSTRLEKTFKFFKENDIKYYALSHCTGEHIEELKKEFKDQFILNNTGNVIEF